VCAEPRAAAVLRGELFSFVPGYGSSALLMLGKKENVARVALYNKTHLLKI
jgi:hypothetical protein